MRSGAKIIRKSVKLLREKIQNIADGVGSSTKTVQRALKQLSEKGLITRKGRTIYIKKDQYRKIEKLLNEGLDQKGLIRSK